MKIQSLLLLIIFNVIFLFSCSAINEKQLNISTSAKDNDALLYSASKMGRKDLVSQLIASGADVNSRNSKGIPPLFVAVEAGHLQVTELLLNNGANANVSAGNLRTSVLIRAVVSGNEKIVTLLLANKANPNITDKEGYGPLFFAAQFGHIKIVKLLLDSGASPNTETKNGNVALDIAISKEHEAIVDFLLSHGANVNKTEYTLHDAIYIGYKNLYKALIDAGADINPKIAVGTSWGAVKNNAGTSTERSVVYSMKTPLIAAIYQKDLSLVKMLIQSGAELNMQYPITSVPLTFIAKPAG